MPAQVARSRWKASCKFKLAGKLLASAGSSCQQVGKFQVASKLAGKMLAQVGKFPGQVACMLPWNLMAIGKFPPQVASNGWNMVPRAQLVIFSWEPAL